MIQWIFAVDPGPEKSGWVLFNTHSKRVAACDVSSNDEIKRQLSLTHGLKPLLAVEMIASYGMPVGREVFETCVWIGRLMEFWHPLRCELVYRKDVKMHLCGTPRAKDPNIRQALIDKLGPPGKKADPGPTYGVSSHAWAALGVAVTASETLSMEPA